jgi:hypothetical protein
MISRAGAVAWGEGGGEGAASDPREAEDIVWRVDWKVHCFPPAQTRGKKWVASVPRNY